MKNYDNIPEELTSLKQWVCAWKTSKVPMQADKYKASSCSNESLWFSFEDARESVRLGNYEDIGFVFNDNGIVGIDIDVGFDEYHLLSDVAYDIITTCKSYTEFSRSGRGMHIYLKGNLPFKGKNNGLGLEIYKDDRYFIVTGNKLIYPTIIENQQAIDYVVDKYFKDVPKEQTKIESFSSKIYTPTYELNKSNKLKLNPTYPKMLEGSRHISMVSLAGQLHNSGATAQYIFKELCRVNEIACVPPLPIKELESITQSILKYERK